MASREELREDEEQPLAVRRITVDDSTRLPPEVRGRRLDEPPDVQLRISSVKARWLTNTRRPRLYLFVAIGACGVLIILVAFLSLRRPASRATVTPSARNDAGEKVAPPPDPHAEALRRIEEDAKQVMRRISRDNRPYSFNEDTIRTIHVRAQEISRVKGLPRSLQVLQSQTEAIRARAATEGLQPSLVGLVALALTKGEQAENLMKTVSTALPVLGSLNKTFGSSEADGSLLLIAAFREGTGTRRSHPLLRRMNQVVNNPMTERNVWYLYEQNILAQDAYDLVVDTIALGVIVRNPRHFGLDNDPISL